MDEIVVPKYEEHFTAFIDLLGFRDVSTGTDETTRLKVLAFLVSLAALRGEFDVQSTHDQTGTTTHIKPAVSTFSDHIVISYPLAQITASTGFDESRTALSILFNLNQLLSRIAVAAFAIGFLIRGGATIGKLYHSNGVIFGEALVEAYLIESTTSVYPRVVLSSNVCNRENWMKTFGPILRRGTDGLYYFNYFFNFMLSSAPPGEHWQENMKAWFNYVVQQTANNLVDLERKGKLKELAKWAWFAHEFRSTLESAPANTLNAFGLSLDAVPWAH